MRTILLLVLFCLGCALYAACEFKGFTGYYHALPSLVCAFLIIRHKLKLAECFSIPFSLFLTLSKTLAKKNY